MINNNSKEQSKMKKRFLIILFVIPYLGFSQTTSVGNTSWKAAEFQLQTKWSKNVSPTNGLNEYPRPQMVRNEWINLNGLWEYAITDSTTYRPNNFDGQILVPYPIESALSGVKKALLPNQKLFYERTIDLKEKKTDRRYLLHFGAVDYQCNVLINGKEVGSHIGGYQSFSIDISSALQKGTNELMVEVIDPSDKGNNPRGKQVLKPGGIMYTASSGIWQTVWLEIVPLICIESLKMIPNVDKGSLQLSVNVKGFNKDYSLETKVENKILRFAQNDRIEIPVANAHLWSPDDPFLYNLNVRLLYKGKVVDEVSSYFGMRKIEVKKDEQGQERIFLNNKYTFNLGVLDQGFWPDGLHTAPTDAALKFDIEAIKSMGFNTIRKHIKIEPERWYYWADKLGMLVWQDMPHPANISAEAKEEYEKENEANMQQLYNHPSIVCWILFNEGWNKYDQERLTNWMKKTDPTRLINGHSGENYDRNSPRNVNEKWISSDIADIHDYPGPDIAPALTGKARVLGEWGGVRVATPGHQWDGSKSWGYIESGAADFAKKYEFMMKHLKLFEEEGLSAAIYTQPFDVEIEENGLITYDRQVFKIPVENIKAINAIMFKMK